MICRMAKENNKKIYLSGQGADEIFSDYGFNGKSIFDHSNFGGLFPNDLRTIFPWPSFFESSQRSYLTKEEYIAGSYGLEARYPFLDKAVVQEFLWLSVDLKNKNYKNVLHNLMSIRNFPFNVGVKTGFIP
jgi:asparagine synthetase B (glutamine-hydrolysing)